MKFYTITNIKSHGGILHASQVFIGIILLLNIVACDSFLQTTPPPTEQEIRDKITGKWIFDGVLNMRLGHKEENVGVIQTLEFSTSSDNDKTSMFEGRFGTGLWIETDTVETAKDGIRSDRTRKNCANMWREESNYSISDDFINIFPKGYQVSSLKIIMINDHMLVAELGGGTARKFVNQKYYDTLSQDMKKDFWTSKVNN